MIEPEDLATFNHDVMRIKKENLELFQEFAGYLVNHDFEGDIIKSHITNIDIYLNQFLVYFDPVDATEARYGTSMIDEFFEEWLPNRTDEANTSAADFLESIGLFYKWLAEETGMIDECEFEELLDLVAHRKNDWL